jgi:hypothetical protein
LAHTKPKSQAPQGDPDAQRDERVYALQKPELSLPSIAAWHRWRNGSMQVYVATDASGVVSVRMLLSRRPEGYMTYELRTGGT